MCNLLFSSDGCYLNKYLDFIVSGFYGDVVILVGGFFFCGEGWDFLRDLGGWFLFGFREYRVSGRIDIF